MKLKEPQNPRAQRRFPRIRRRLSTMTCAVATAVCVHTVHADEYDTLNLVLSTSITRDSNLFRISDGADPQAVLGTPRKSDTVSVSALTLRVDKSISLQRFQLEVSETIYRYDNFSFLNFEALEYRGVWLWSLTPRIKGTLGADRRKSLVPFGDIRAAQQNLRVADRRYATVEAQVTGGWHALAGASQFRQTDSRPALSAEPSYDAVSGEGGVKYLASPGRSVALIQRRVEGDYKNSLDAADLIDDGFHENQTEVVADWLATGKSTLRGRLAWVDRHHDHFAARDYDAWVGEATYLWAPTGKSRFNFALKRDVSAWWEQRASYRVSDSASASYTWQLAHRTALLVQFDRTQRDYRGPVIATAGPLREDEERSAQLGVNWTPLRALVLNASVQRYTRSSNVAGNDYDANVGNISAAFTF